MRRVLREQIEEVVAPLRTALEGAKTEIAQLQAVDRKHSGEHRSVRSQLLPQLASDVNFSRAGDMNAVAAAYEKLGTVVNQLGDRFDKIEKAVLVEVHDKETNKTSLVPAAPLALQSATRTEEKTQQIADNQDRAFRWYRHPGLYIVSYAVLETIARLLGWK
jgi:hypothetical protein